MNGSPRAARVARTGHRALPAVIAAALLTPLMFFSIGVPGAQADSVSDRKAALGGQLDDLRETLEGTNQDLVDAAVKLKRAQSGLADAQDSLSAAEAALAAAKAKDDAIAARLAVAQADADKAQRDLDARAAQEVDTRERIGSIVRETYVSSGLSGLSIALNAESPEQFADRVSASSTALRSQNGAIARLQVQQAETRARTAKLDAARAEVTALKRESEALVAERAKAQQQAADAEASIEKITHDKAAALSVIAGRRADERRRINSLQQEEDRLASILRARARREGSSGGGGGGGDGGGTLSHPVNAPITSGFGMRYHPVLHYWRLHAGTDFGAPCGTPVHAAAGGSVVRAGWAGGFGNQVVIDNGRMRGKNISTSYNHLSRIIKHTGKVARGQLIGYSGTTGLSTGCHLHFEVYVNGTHVNPMGWL